MAILEVLLVFMNKINDLNFDIISSASNVMINLKRVHDKVIDELITNLCNKDLSVASCV